MNFQNENENGCGSLEEGMHSKILTLGIVVGFRRKEILMFLWVGHPNSYDINTHIIHIQTEKLNLIFHTPRIE